MYGFSQGGIDLTPVWAWTNGAWHASGTRAPVVTEAQVKSR